MTYLHQVKTETLWGVYRHKNIGSDDSRLYISTVSRTRRDAIDIFRREYGHIIWFKSDEFYVTKCFVVQEEGNKYRFDIRPSRALK